MLWASESVEYLATVKRFLRSSKWAIFAIIDGSAQENCTLRMCLYQPLPLGRRFLSAAKLNVEQPTSSDQRRTTSVGVLTVGVDFFKRFLYTETVIYKSTKIVVSFKSLRSEKKYSNFGFYQTLPSERSGIIL
jgi:hypothetical protein